jgi:Ca-activated chloride channel family protein
MSRDIFVRKSTAFVLSILSLLLFSTVSAQNEKPAAAPDQLVKFNVIVTDPSDRAMDDVRKEDLQVLEDGVPQTISYFARDERPVTCGFVIDASGSVRRVLNYLIDSAKIAAEGLRTGDEGFVASFVDRDNFKIKEQMTSDREAVADSLDDIYVEGGPTAVQDAVDKALKYLEENKGGDVDSRRRILVLVSDGEDRGSRIKDSRAVLTSVRQSDVQVFVLGLTRFSGLQTSAGKAMDFLNGLAEQSGGQAFLPDLPSGLPDAAREIARHFHTQYAIGYTANSKSLGAERRVQVKWVGRADQGKRRVIARPTVIIR